MNKNPNILTKLLEITKKCGASGADAILFETTSLSISQRLGKPEGIERSENSAVGLRVFVRQKNGEIGQANVSSTDVSRDALLEVAERAVAMAKIAPADNDSTLASSELYPNTIPTLDLLDEVEPTPAWLLEQCAIAEDAARSVSGITNSEGADASYSHSRVSLAIAGENGADFSGNYEGSYFSTSVSVLAGTGTSMERDYDFSSARHRSDLRNPKEIGLSAANRTLKRLNPRKVASCQTSVIFDPRVSKSLASILTSSISGSAIARGSSFLKNSLNKQIFAKGISIIDNPHLLRGFASKPFDMEGVANKKISLVEDGVLQTWLLDIRTANKLKLQTTGHASRGLASPPSPSSTNVYMENGTLSPKELMSDIKSGLYLTETFGMGINIITGDYSQGAAGFWIENGEIAYPVSEITIAGNLKDMFANLTPANDLAFHYSTNAPTVRVENMTVAGV
ncbi:MAG: TldD/PmbA family protein [Rickettsiales bacterium]